MSLTLLVRKIMSSFLQSCECFKESNLGKYCVFDCHNELTLIGRKSLCKPPLGTPSLCRPSLGTLCSPPLGTPPLYRPPLGIPPSAGPHWAPHSLQPPTGHPTLCRPSLGTPLSAAPHWYSSIGGLEKKSEFWHHTLPRFTLQYHKHLMESIARL